MTTAIYHCKACRKDTVHDVGVVNGAWALLSCQVCSKQASKAKKGTKTMKSDIIAPLPNKHHAVRTWSEMCQTWFASKGECAYGESLYLRQKAGEIVNLEFHKKFILCEKPKKRTIEVDFVFKEYNRSKEDKFADLAWKWLYQDFKGHPTRDYETRRLWLFDKLGIEVEIVK